MIPPFIQVDFEVTNRCNAKCHFCPCDATPHQGLMSPEIFEQSLARTIEFRTRASDLLGKEIHIGLCGLGEPLLNKHIVEYVRRVRAEGFYCSLSTNGALLDERRATELLDAGLPEIDINVGEIDDDYEDVYKLPFERTRDNVVRFAELAEGRCMTRVVLVDHRRDYDHMREMVAYWRERGIDEFLPFPVMNRGGALFVDDMQYDSYPEHAEAAAIFAERGADPICQAPFVFLFIGYDGQYYLCCSDWTKLTPMGSVFERSFEDVTGQKLQHVLTREPVCRTCNHDPLNHVTGELRAMHNGDATEADVQAAVDGVLASDQLARSIVTALGIPMPDARPASAAGDRRLIPLRTS